MQLGIIARGLHGPIILKANLEILNTYRNRIGNEKQAFSGQSQLHVTLQYPAHRKPKIPQAFWPNLQIFEAEHFSRLLLIIFNIGKVKIRGSYHNILGLISMGDTMALS
jgi:hypothetical protein